MAASLEAEIVLSAKDLASPAIKDVGSSLEEVTGSAEKADGAFGRIKDGFESGMGFAAGITGFRELKDVLDDLGDATVNFNGSLEQTTLRLDNLTGSADGTSEVIGRVKDLSDESPFAFNELETANERLLRFNFSTDKAADLLKVATDAAAGMGAGASGVDTITEAFGRMNSRTELNQRGIMALVGMGVPAFDMLAKGLGITTAQAEDLTKKGLIPSADAINILSAALESKYPEMGAKIGGTFDSLKKTIGDTMDFIFAELGKPVFDVLENSAKDWLAWLQSPDVKAAVSDFASGLASSITAAGEAFNAVKGPIGDFANDVKTVAGGALQFIADRLSDAGSAWAPWAAQAGASGKVVDDSLTGTSEIVQALQFLLQGNFKAAWQDASKAVGDFRNAIDPLRQVLEDNKALIIGAAAALGTFMVLETVVPLVVTFTTALQALNLVMAATAAVFESEGIIAGLGLFVSILGGPVTLAIAGVALAAGALAVAWSNNWGDIQDTIKGAATELGTDFGNIRDWLVAVRDEAGKLGAWDDLRTVWDDLKDAGNALWGQMKDSFTPSQDGLNATLSGGPKSADTSAHNAASAIKDLTADISHFATEVKTVTQAAQGMVDGLNAFKKSGDDVAISIHNWVADEIKPLVDLLHNFGDWLDSHTFGIHLEIPGLSLITQSITDLQKLAASPTTAGGNGGVPLAPAGESAAFNRPSQFSDPQLSGAEALAACGPAALVAFMRANGGRAPTLREAVDLARTTPGAGWDTTAGMETGLAGEQALLGAGGLSSTMTYSPTEAQIQTGANTGTGEIIDTLGHFFTASGYNAETGQYNVGTSGSDLKGGSPYMTLADMTSLMGPVLGVLTDIKSSSSATADATGKAAANQPSASDTEQMIRAAASANNINPDIAVRVWQGEGSQTGAGAGDQGSSFGPFQLHMGGIASGGNAVAGAGDTFMQQTGLDPRDPANAQAATNWYLHQVSVSGTWNASHGAAAVGVGSTEGIGQLPYPGANSFVGPTGAANTAASPTEPVGLSAAAQAEIAKQAEAAQGVPGLTELDKLVQTTTKYLDDSVAKEAAKAGPGGTLETTAARATASIDTGLTSKLGEDLTGQTSGSLFTQRAVADDTKARKDALTQQIQDESVANNISVAADELRYKRGEEDQQVASQRAREDDDITNNQKLAHEALLHSRSLEDAQIAYDHGLQLEATAHQRKLEDQAIVANKILQDAATAHSNELAHEQLQLNVKLANAATLHQRALEDAQIAPNEALSAAATTHSRGLQDQDTAYAVQQSQVRDAAALQVNLAAATSDAQRAQIQQTYDAQVKANALQAQYAAEDLAHQRAQEDQEAKYQEGLAATALAKSRALQDAETAYQSSVADQNLTDSEARAKTEADYQAGLAATALQVSRHNADVEQTYQDGLAKTALEHSRSLQDAEVQYQIGLAHDALMRKRAEEDAARADARKQEDADVAHQIEVQQAARDFAKAQQQQQADLDKKLADEAYARQIDDLKAQAATAKQNIADKLVLDKQAAIEAAQTERDTKKAAFDDAAAAIIAKSKTAVEAAGGDFAPIEAKMAQTVGAMDQAFATAHGDASAALADLATQAAAALGNGGKVPAAVQATVAAFGQSAIAISASLGITDTAIETSADHIGATWDQTRIDLNTMVAAYGVGAQQISDAFGITDKAVEQYAQDHHTNWDKARVDLNTAAIHAGEVLGTDGTIPKAINATTTAFDAMQTAAGKTSALDQLKKAAQELTNQGLDPASQAAKDLAKAILEIQDRTITVTTNYVDNGSPVGSQQAANANISGGSGISEGTNRNNPGTSGGFDLSNQSGRADARTQLGSGFVVTDTGIRNNQTGALVQGFAEGGLVPGPIGTPVLAVVHAGEYVLPVGTIQGAALGTSVASTPATGDTTRPSLDTGGITQQDLTADLHANEAVLPLTRLPDVLQSVGGVLLNTAAASTIAQDVIGASSTNATQASASFAQANSTLAHLADTFRAPPAPVAAPTPAAAIAAPTPPTSILAASVPAPLTAATLPAAAVPTGPAVAAPTNTLPVDQLNATLTHLADTFRAPPVAAPLATPAPAAFTGAAVGTPSTPTPALAASALATSPTAALAGPASASTLGASAGAALPAASAVLTPLATSAVAAPPLPAAVFASPVPAAAAPALSAPLAPPTPPASAFAPYATAASIPPFPNPSLVPAVAGISGAPATATAPTRGGDYVLPASTFQPSGSGTPTSSTGGGMTDTQMATLARLIAGELAKLNLTVGVDAIHSALLQKQRRSGALKLK